MDREWPFSVLQVSTNGGRAPGGLRGDQSEDSNLPLELYQHTDTLLCPYLNKQGMRVRV